MFKGRENVRRRGYLFMEVYSLIMHGRSRMTIDPRIPTMPGWSTSGFHRPDRHAYTKREAPWGVRRVAWRVSCILQKNRLWGVLSCMLMTASNELICFLVQPLPETAMIILLICDCLCTYKLPLCVVKLFHPARMMYYSTASHGDRHKKNKSKRNNNKRLVLVSFG